MSKKTLEARGQQSQQSVDHGRRALTMLFGVMLVVAAVDGLAPAAAAQDTTTSGTGKPKSSDEVHSTYLSHIERSVPNYEVLPHMADIRSLLETLGIQLQPDIQVQVPFTCNNMTVEDVAIRLRKALKIVVDDTRSDVNGDVVMFRAIKSCIIQHSEARDDGAVTVVTFEGDSSAKLSVQFGINSWGNTVANELFHMIVNSKDIVRSTNMATAMQQLTYIELLSLLQSWDAARRARIGEFSYDPLYEELRELADKTLNTVGFSLTTVENRSNLLHILKHLDAFITAFGTDNEPLVELANLIAYIIGKDVVLATGENLTKQILCIVECLILDIPYNFRSPLIGSPIVSAIDKAIGEKLIAQTSESSIPTEPLRQTASAGWTIWDGESEEASILIRNISFDFDGNTKLSTCDPNRFISASVTTINGVVYTLPHTDFEPIKRVGSPFVDFRITRGDVLSAMREGGSVSMKYSVYRSNGIETEVQHTIPLQPNNLSQSQAVDTMHDYVLEFMNQHGITIPSELQRQTAGVQRQKELVSTRIENRYSWEQLSVKNFRTLRYTRPSTV